MASVVEVLRVAAVTVELMSSAYPAPPTIGLLPTGPQGQTGATGAQGANGTNQTAVYIDPVSGNDANNGSDAAPVRTLTAAAALNPTDYFVRVGTPVRLAAGLSYSLKSRLRFHAWRKAGDTETRAKVWCSTNYAAASWTTAGGATPNLYYVSLAVNPHAVWEADASGNATRLLSDNTITSTTAANATPGCHYYDTGAQRLYVHPYGGAIAGKSYEVPTALNAITFTNCNDVNLRDVEFSFARDYIVSFDNSSGTGTNCRFGRCGSINGSGNGLDLRNGATWNGLTNTHDDCGNDGAGTYTRCKAIHVGCVFNLNKGDGASSDGSQSDLTLISCEARANVKDGAVKIEGGNLRIHGGFYEENGDKDILVYNPVFDVFVFMTGVTAHITEFDKLNTGNIYATIRNHVGPIGNFGGIATVDGLMAHSKGLANKSLYGLRSAGGTLSIENFIVRGFTYGLMLTGGTFKARAGQALNNTTANVYQTAALTGWDLSSADPVNVYSRPGGAPNFANVSAGDQALFVSIAAA